MRYALAGVLAFVCLPAWGEDLPPSTALATQQYETAIAKAKAEYEAKERAARQMYILRLQEAALTEGRKGNLDGAVAIKKRIEELSPSASSTLDIQEGLYQTQNGLFRLSRDEKGTWSLSNENDGFHSTESAVIDGRLVFDWTNNRDLMILEKEGKAIFLLCYSGAARGGLPTALPDKSTPPYFKLITQFTKNTSNKKSR